MNFTINEEELKREMAEMPGHMADICSRIATARNNEDRCERNYKITRYAIERDFRNLYQNKVVFGTKPTEDAIKMEVALSPAVKAASEALFEAACALRLLEAELTAYTCKRDMVVSLSAYVRSELETTRFSNAR